MTWTPPQLVRWIAEDLKQKGFDPPHRFQAEMLVSHALKLSRLELYLQHDKPCTAAEQERLRELIKRRYRYEPIAYILGTADFWSLSLKVGPGVLIPRQETEVLVETALELIPDDHPSTGYQILELGTGSAAIPLAFCSSRTHLSITATEFSAEALAYARHNRMQYEHLLAERSNRLVLVQMDRFSAIHPETKANLIISNPPYIPDHQLRTLQRDVSEWEPLSALEGGKTGIDFYQYLFQAAIDTLTPNGYLVVEHGFDQAENLTRLIKEIDGLGLVKRQKDYSGHDRVLVIQKRQSAGPTL